MMLLVLLERLRFKDGPAVRSGKFKHGPWPLEMFFWALIPEMLAPHGYTHTVCIDPDVFANDGRLWEELPKIRGGCARGRPR